MSMSPYMPLPAIHHIIKRYAKSFNPNSRLKYALRVHSLWYYDKENSTITICTNLPGHWIGNAGSVVEKLQSEINAEVEKHNDFIKRQNFDGSQMIKPITVRFIECDC